MKTQNASGRTEDMDKVAEEVQREIDARVGADSWFSLTEVAVFTSRAVSTIYKHAAEGLIRPEVVAGTRRMRVSREELMRYVEATAPDIAVARRRKAGK